MEGVESNTGEARGKGSSLYVPDEPGVGLDAGALALDEVKRGVVGHVVCVEQIGDDHCGRARHALEDAGWRGKRTGMA